MREEAVLDEVPLGASWRIVGYPDKKACAIRELLHLLFEQMASVGTPSTAVREHQQFRGLGIIVPTAPVPPQAHAVHRELSRFAAFAKHHEPVVKRHVIDSKWRHFSLRQVREVMIPAHQLLSFLNPKPPLAVEAPEVFLFLAVDADCRNAPRPGILAQALDPLKLLVPIRARVDRLLFDRLVEREFF